MRALMILLMALLAITSRAHSQVVANEQHVCLNRFADYLKELEEMLEVNDKLSRQSIIPFDRLNAAFFPLRNCDVEELETVAKRSRYFWHTENKANGVRLFLFRSRVVRVIFGYSTPTQTSDIASARWLDE